MILHPRQKEIVESKTRFKVIRSGRRSGKSSVCIEIMLFEAMREKGNNIFYVSPTQKQSRSIIWESLKSRLAGIGKLNESRLEAEVPTADGGTSHIYLSGFEARENFRGLKADLIVFDELDTMPNFFVGWQEIFRPALTDTEGRAIFVGTPKKENPNLRRLEKQAEVDEDWEGFQFATSSNPHIPKEELAKAEKELDYDTYKQEYLAEYVENAGALFKYDALIDVFSNTVDKTSSKYLIVDIADDGSDKTIFSFWEGLEEYRVESFARLNTESIIDKIREYAAQDRIPYSNITVDAIGVGAGVASSSMLDGVVGFKSSYGAIKTDQDIIKLPNVGYLPNAPSLTSNYRNLRSQCLFTLADLINNHKIASKVDGTHKEKIIEELSTYQDASKGDGKRLATLKEDVKASIGRSPDDSDTWVMRMYFVIKERMLPQQSEENVKMINTMKNQFNRNKSDFSSGGNR
jgi:hypothetical protein